MATELIQLAVGDYDVTIPGLPLGRVRARRDRAAADPEVPAAARADRVAARVDEGARGRLPVRSLRLARRRRRPRVRAGDPDARADRHLLVRRTTARTPGTRRSCTRCRTCGTATASRPTRGTTCGSTRATRAGTSSPGPRRTTRSRRTPRATRTTRATRRVEELMKAVYAHGDEWRAESGPVARAVERRRAVRLPALPRRRARALRAAPEGRPGGVRADREGVPGAASRTARRAPTTSSRSPRRSPGARTSSRSCASGCTGPRRRRCRTGRPDLRTSGANPPSRATRA